MTGVLLAVPPADFVLHNNMFLVAHFHNVIIGGVVFGLFAGITFWFPKAFGYKLDPFWGKVMFWFWLVGFYCVFMPLYWVGFMGAQRRWNHHDDPSMQIYFIIAAFGAVLIAVWDRVVPHRPCGELHEAGATARSDGRSLEWTDPGVVHILAAAALQLCVHAGHPRSGCLVGHEAARL